MTRLYLIRHGESEWNAARRLQGQADPPLSVRGEDQVRALGGMLSRLHADRVVVSDLQRACRSAELLGLDAAPDPAWREIDVGDWTGRSTDELRAEHAELWTGWRAGEYTPEGGEPWADFLRRITIAARGAAAGAERVLAVTHGGVIRALTASVLGVGPGRLAPVQPASLTVLDLAPHARLRSYDLRPAWSGQDAPD